MAKAKCDSAKSSMWKGPKSNVMKESDFKILK